MLRHALCRLMILLQECSYAIRLMHLIFEVILFELWLVNHDTSLVRVPCNITECIWLMLPCIYCMTCYGMYFMII